MQARGAQVVTLFKVDVDVMTVCCHSIHYFLLLLICLNCSILISSSQINLHLRGQLLAVGGSVPVLDLISVIGHKEAVLCPL